MNHNALLARISMVSGELVPPDEVLPHIAMFGYRLDDPDLNKFSYQEDSTGTSDIRVFQDGALIELWGTHEEDVFTLQALAKKLGWEVGDMTIVDASIEERLIRNFTVLKLREVRSLGPGSTLDEVVADSVPSIVEPVSGTGGNVEELSAETRAFPTTEIASSEADDLRAEIKRLKETILVLRQEKQQQTVYPNTAEPNADARTRTLIGVLVDSLIDLSNNPVVKQLSAHGFNVRVIVE